MAERLRKDLGFNPLYASLSRQDLDQAVVYDPNTQQLFHREFPTTDPVSASAYIGLISASYSTAQTNYILVFNGTSFVPVPQGTSFEFSITDFSVSGVGSNSQLIGDGVWKAASDLTFTATYNAGPPTEASVSLAGNLSGDGFSMTPPDFTGGTNPSSINYPTSVGNAAAFTLSATKSLESGSDTTTTLVTFKNFIAWGGLSTNTGLTTSDVDTLYSDNFELTTTGYTKNITSLTLGSGEYFGFAYRAGASSNPSRVHCGTGGNKITVAMNSTAQNATPLVHTISSYPNANGFTENYKIIASYIQDITNHSPAIDVSSTAQTYNYLYWGTGSTDPTTGTEVVEFSFSASYSSSIDNVLLNVDGTYDPTRIYIAIPSRYGDKGTDYQFKDNITSFEFAAADSSTATIGVTNPVGFQENYNIMSSSQLLSSPQVIKIETL